MKKAKRSAHFSFSFQIQESSSAELFVSIVLVAQNLGKRLKIKEIVMKKSQKKTKIKKVLKTTKIDEY